MQRTESIDEIYHRESRAALATLIRLLGNFDLAEESLQEAFAVAADAWPRDGVPENPRAWLISTGRFKAIDAIRRQSLFRRSQEDISLRFDAIAAANAARDGDDIGDDQLRLIFTCCHPAIAPSIQVPLTLREVCGLTTEEIANAFLTSPATMAQRIVRGKSKIRDAGIPYVIPSADELPERLESVLVVIYLVFNEGYSASSGDSVTRGELSEEAIRLGRLLVSLLPDPEAVGLLALMLLQESRRTARTSDIGDVVLLEDQDRTRWNQTLIREGLAMVDQVTAAGRFGSYSLQAAIAAVHARAAHASETDWNQIVSLYDALGTLNPSPVIELNRGVAIAMRDGPEAGIAIIDGILANGQLTDYHLSHAALADLYRRLGKFSEAESAYQRALALAKQEPEQRFLRKRLEEILKRGQERMARGLDFPA